MAPKKTILTPPVPPDRPHKVMQDSRAKFQALTAQTPVNQAARDAFMQNRLRMAHTRPGLGLHRRNQAVAQVAASLGIDPTKFLNEPIPGGVGYGFYYNTAFKTSWGRGTGFIYDIICPNAPGGNVTTWLYLTATNRAGKGVEALVAYDGQAMPSFKVFDWARPDPWQVDSPFTGLGDYLTTSSAHGLPYQVLPVWNSTWLINDTTYRNQVNLYNQTRNGWDMVYQFDYAATDQDQKNAWPGTWGPIVETFQPAYSQTNSLGALNIKLSSADAGNNWGDWALLSASNADLQPSTVGFNQVFLDPDSAFAVNS